MESKSQNVFCTSTNFEVRELGEEKKACIQGYALKFDSMSEDMGFRELISRGALDQADLSDIYFTFNHAEDKIMARNNKTEGVGSLKISVDNEGLFFEAIPTDTSYSRDLIENVRNGIIDKCSFRFSLDWEDPDTQTWDWDTGTRGYDLRTIHKIKKIRDVSLVTIPAYSQATATTYKRAKEGVETERTEAIEREKLLLELEM